MCASHAPVEADASSGDGAAPDAMPPDRTKYGLMAVVCSATLRKNGEPRDGHRDDCPPAA